MTVPIISNSECDEVFGVIEDGVICISTEGGKGTCNVSCLTIFMSRLDKTSYEDCGKSIKLLPCYPNFPSIGLT